MSSSFFTHVISELSEDIHNPQFFWQVASLLFSLALAWLIARYARKFFIPKGETTGVIQIGVESFSRVLWPILALLFLFLAKLILARWQHTSLLQLFIPIISSFALIRFGFYVFRRAFARKGTVGSTLLIFEKVFAGLVWCGAVLYFTGLWAELFSTLDDIVLPLGKSKLSLLAALQALASVAVTLVLAMWVSAMLEARLMLVPSMHSSLKVVLSRLGRAILILCAILISLSLVGIDLTVLSVFGGALGVGLGLGLQKITSSYVSGFIILFDRSLAIGDMISLDKFSGTVTQINTRYTVLKGLDGGESIIPNEMLVSNAVQNYSLTDHAVVLTTDLTVGYDTDIESLLPLLIEATARIERVSTTVEPSAYLLRFGADGLDLRVAFWIEDPENGKTNVISLVNCAIWTLLKEKGIQIPYPQRELRIVQTTVQTAAQTTTQATDINLHNHRTVI